MQKLPEAPDRKRGDACAKKEPPWQKKEARTLSAVSSVVTTPKSFLLLVEGTMHPSLDDALANLSTSSSHPFYPQPTTKNTKMSKSQLRHHITDLTITSENTGFRHIS